MGLDKQIVRLLQENPEGLRAQEIAQCLWGEAKVDFTLIRALCDLVHDRIIKTSLARLPYRNRFLFVSIYYV